MLWGVSSCLAVTVCTAVDAVLVGNFVGSSGLAVANLATPVFLAYALVGMTLAVGANVQIGRCLGGRRPEEANALFRAVMLCGLAAGVLIAVPATAFAAGMCRFLGAEGELLPLARSYLTVVFACAPVFVLYHILSLTVRTDGDPRLAAAASAVVITANLTLDLVFMKGLGWGVLGASASLCVAEALGVCVLLSHFWKKHALLRLGLGLPKGGDVRGFVTNGFGVGSAYIFQALVMLVFNNLLLSGPGDGVLYVAVFGILYTMSTVPGAVFDGSGSAISSVVSVLSGEKDGGGMLAVLRQGLLTAAVGGAALAAALALGAGPVAAMFGLEAGLPRDTAATALRIFAGSIVFTGVNTAVTAFWQAIGRAKLAGGMSVMRNCVLMLLLGWAFIRRWQIMGLAAVYAAAEALCSLGALAVWRIRGSRGYIRERFRPADRVFQHNYTIRSESVAEIGRDLEQLCDAWEIPPRTAVFINLMAEELLLNIIKFGLRDEKPHYIDLMILDDGGEYAMRVRDDVRTYNPFDSQGDEIDNAAIRLIRTKTKYCDYQRKLIFNYLYLVIQ